MKNWAIANLNKDNATAMAQKFDLPLSVSMLLDIRGINKEEDIDSFFSEEPYIFDPFTLIDMDKAVARIHKALDDFEKICIFGDYDADGVTSTALLYSHLETLSADVMYYIPNRETEGYGMNMSAIDFINSQNVSLIITVDNGVSANEEIDYAKSLGIDTVVTDHHMPSGDLPNAVAVVNPHRNDCPSKYKDLAGVGVTLKLVMALEGEENSYDVLENYADLVAIGTIGDIVPLKSENRSLVKLGLQKIMNTERPGIAALLNESGLYNKKLTAGNIAFSVVPRLNAVGRLALSEKSVRLLLSEDPDESSIIAKELSVNNSERQSIEKDIQQKILDIIRQNPALLINRIIVVPSENIHPGVIGIVASRIRDIFDKPVIIISEDGEICKGSGRSVTGFSLSDALFSCSSLLEHHGGHPMAIGLSIKKENIPLFTEKINEYAKIVYKDFMPEMVIDCKLNPSVLSTQMAHEITLLEPFGQANAKPLYGLYNMKLISINEIGQGKHLKLTFSRNETRITAMYFFMTKSEFSFQINDETDLAVTIDVNVYNGIEN
ncbi:MAG: single-stranded-DNA-specific exonuclease RecJ, partial [Bacillota bacterium]|nr:single-stranded-DNA-specific exonuclease RecJ [Bacillota bacterium]